MYICFGWSWKIRIFIKSMSLWLSQYIIIIFCSKPNYAKKSCNQIPSLMASVATINYAYVDDRATCCKDDF